VTIDGRIIARHKLAVEDGADRRATPTFRAIEPNYLSGAGIS
jgi:hypothetical protein